MKYNFELNRCVNSGKLRASFHCEHCNKSNMYLSACFYSAMLHNDQSQNTEEASKEFVANINNRKFNMFMHKKASKQLKSSLCHCSTNVVCIKAHKAKVKAQSIVKAGIHKLHRKDTGNF